MLSGEEKTTYMFIVTAVLPDGNEDFAHRPKFLTIEKERQDGIIIAIC